jgi:5-hydroxyisourate hydrolase
VAVAQGTTDQNGRAVLVEPASPLSQGRYRIEFAVAEYFARESRACFYPVVQITFDVAQATEHYHVPLLVSPFGYSTYRGS